MGIALLGGALALNSLLGPLTSGVIEYHYGTSMANQGIGLDAVALALAAPIALAAAALTARAHRAGPVLAFAPATFAAYMMPQYVIGPDHLGLPGNNERAVPFHLATFVLAVAVAIGAWRAVALDGPATTTGRHDRRRAWVLFAVAAFTALGRWLPSLVAVMGDQVSAAYRDNPTAFWLIAFLDLGVVVPAAVTAGIGLWRGAAWSRVASWAVFGWVSLVPASVAAMAITMQLRGDPLASADDTIVVTTAAVVLTAAVALLYRPLLRPGRIDDATRAPQLPQASPRRTSPDS